MTNIEKICAYFQAGCNEKKAIGMELEHFVCDENERLASYETICELLKEAEGPSEGTLYLEHGHIFGLQCKEYALTLEPAGQLEISMDPQERISEIERIYTGFRRIWDELLKKKGLHFVQKGVYPLVENGEVDPEDIPLIPKKRYEYMDRYFKQTGNHGAYMMRATASTQVSVDYSSEDDARRKMRILNRLSPFLSLFMENQSGLGRKKGFEKHLLRTQIWNDVDPDRCGYFPGSLHRKYKFPQYAEYVYEKPMIFLKTPGQELEVKEKSAKDICIEAAKDMPQETVETAKDMPQENSEAEITFTDHMLSMFFPHVRLKKYVELRTGDSVPIERALGYAALMKGLLYGEGNMDILDVIFQEIDRVEQIKEAEAAIMKDGYYAEAYGEPVVNQLHMICEFAMMGLDEEEQEYLKKSMPLPILEYEYRKDIEKDMRGHAATAQEAKQYVLNSTAKYHNRVPRSMYIPKLFTKKEVEICDELIGTLFDIFKKVMKEYKENPEYRKLFGFDERMEELILKEEAYSTEVPMARIDIFYEEETGEFKFCEFNTDGTSAMNEDRELNNAMKLTKAYEAFTKNHKIETFELFDSWVEEFAAIYDEYVKKYGRAACAAKSLDGEEAPNAAKNPADEKMSNTAKTFDRSKIPTVAIVDFLEHATYSEFEVFKERFEAHGMPCVICDVRNISWDGEHCYTPEGVRIDAIYRRAVTSDILSHYDEVQGLIEAVKCNGVCLVGEFRTQIVHNKILYKVLHLPETMKLLTENERRYVKAHVPYTVSLTKELLETNAALKEEVYAGKNGWIIKPEDSYGSYGVHAGVECKTAEEWIGFVEEALDKGYILQEFCTPYRLPNVDLLNEKPELRKWCTTSNLTGIFVYNGRMKGLYSRTSFSDIISTQYSEMSSATIIVE
ncbi:MAG: hypothetical protein E7253_07605 [Lachnospiraceae bacterium]|nr:hypothetical protein [Lachnospiraceae bacterium]